MNPSSTTTSLFNRLNRSYPNTIKRLVTSSDGSISKTPTMYFLNKYQDLRTFWDSCPKESLRNKAEWFCLIEGHTILRVTAFIDISKKSVISRRHNASVVPCCSPKANKRQLTQVQELADDVQSADNHKRCNSWNAANPLLHANFAGI